MYRQRGRARELAHCDEHAVINLRRPVRPKRRNKEYNQADRQRCPESLSLQQDFTIASTAT